MWMYEIIYIYKNNEVQEVPTHATFHSFLQYGYIYYISYIYIYTKGDQSDSGSSVDCTEGRPAEDYLEVQ